VELSDSSLVAHVRTDPVALEELYRRHVARVVSFAARRCAEPQDVADLVAATFVSVIESAHTYDARRGDVLPWIIGIERHLLAENGRRHFREREVLARTIGTRAIEGDEFAELEERIDRTRESAEVERALSTLAATEREALLLAGDGLTSEQAAGVVGISATAFRMRLSRARRALRKALDKEGTP